MPSLRCFDSGVFGHFRSWRSTLRGRVMRACNRSICWRTIFFVCKSHRPREPEILHCCGCKLTTFYRTQIDRPNTKMRSYSSAIRLRSVLFFFWRCRNHSVHAFFIAEINLNSSLVALLFKCIRLHPVFAVFGFCFRCRYSGKTFPFPITIRPLHFKLFINSKMYCELGTRAQNDKYSARLIYALDSIRELKTFPMRTATSCGLSCCLRGLWRPPLNRSIPTRLKNLKFKP